MSDILAVRDLEKTFGSLLAARDITVSVPAHQTVGVIGANGAGKTSTLKAVMGLIPRRITTLRFGDVDLSRVGARDMVRHGIGYVPEGRHVFTGLPVEKNLLLGAYARKWDAATRAGLDPTTAGGLNTMTPAQQERELARQQKAIEAAQARAAREAERQRRADEKAAATAARARQRTIDTALRTGGKVVTSRLGQDIVRGVFGVLFGGGKGR